MRDFVEYLVFSLLYPKQRDFISMGLGIRARYERCQAYWDEHLKRSRGFISDALYQFSPKTILILGSGRLLNCPRLEINRLGAKVSCIDIDPVANMHSRRLEPDWRFTSDDVTGAMELWTQNFKDYLISGLRSSDAIGKFLSTLEVPVRELPLNDVIISLNLLGQIPVYWRDRVETLITRYSPISFSLEEDSSDAIHTGLDRSCRSLQEAHIRQIFSSSLKGVILISDRSFDYYVEEGRISESKSALYIEVPSEGSTVESSDSWHWHIAPMGIEENDYGVIHEVVAKSYRASRR